MIGIGRTTTGSRKSLEYIQNDKGKAEIIEQNKILSDNPKEQYWEMRETANQNQYTQKPFYNVVLSPDKKYTKDWSHRDWEKLSQDFTKKMNIDKNQYISTLHTSTGQPHLHIIANRIDDFGNNKIKSHDIHKQTQKVAQQIARENGWHTAQEQSKANAKAPSEEKDRVKKDLQSCVQQSKNYSELNAAMEHKGYQMKYNERNGEKTGLRIVNSKQAQQEQERKREQGEKVTGKEGSYKLSELGGIKIKDIEKQLKENKQEHERPLTTKERLQIQPKDCKSFEEYRTKRGDQFRREDIHKYYDYKHSQKILEINKKGLERQRNGLLQAIRDEKSEAIKQYDKQHERNRGLSR